MTCHGGSVTAVAYSGRNGALGNLCRWSVRNSVNSNSLDLGVTENWPPPCWYFSCNSWKSPLVSVLKASYIVIMITGRYTVRQALPCCLQLGSERATAFLLMTLSYTCFHAYHWVGLYRWALSNAQGISYFFLVHSPSYLFVRPPPHF